MKPNIKFSLYFFYLTALAALGGISSCKKFLDTKPTDFIAPETYYSTEAELNTALIGVYDVLGQQSMYGNGLFNQLAACSDESFYNRSAQTTGVMVNVYDYSNADVSDFWTSAYQGIERANMLIANIDKPKMDETKRKNILAQAKFLRGYYYYLLVISFGDVPLKLTPQASVQDVNVPRTPAKEVYNQILADMKEAEANLNTVTANGVPSYISKTGCQGILARVCLSMAGYPVNDNAKYAEALIWAQKVESSGEHILRTTYDAAITNSSYSQVFINMTQDKYDIKESIWEVEFWGNRTDAYLESGRVGNVNGIQFTGDADSIGYSYGFHNTTLRHFNRYGNGDKRRDWAIAPYRYTNVTTTPTRANWNASQIYNRNMGKWRRSYEILTPKHKNYTPENFPLLRYSDVLLMIAEAENEVNGPTGTAYNALNQVRRRGYELPINSVNATADAPAGMSKDAFRTYIQEERARELCFEALRKNDLIRWGIYVQRMNDVGNEMDNATANPNFRFGAMGGKNVTQRDLLFPIPAAEMNINKAIKENNPGW